MNTDQNFQTNPQAGNVPAAMEQDSSQSGETGKSKPSVVRHAKDQEKPKMKLAKLCYKRHDKRTDQGLPNRHNDPHIHAPYTDEQGRIVKLIWEDVFKPPLDTTPAGE
jgi:hypothetical protein